MRKWFLVQVGLPLGGPVLLSAIFAMAWSTGADGFVPRLDIIADVTPRALTFYSLALISATLADFGPRIGRNPVVAGAAEVTALFVAVYYAFTVVWRHDSAYVPTSETYYVTLTLTGAAIWVSALCHKRKIA